MHGGEDAWWWGCVAMVGRSIAGFWEWREILRVRENVCVCVCVFFFWEGDKRIKKIKRLDAKVIGLGEGKEKKNRGKKLD